MCAYVSLSLSLSLSVSVRLSLSVSLSLSPPLLISIQVYYVHVLILLWSYLVISCCHYFLLQDSSSPLEYPQRPSTPMTPTCDTFPLRDDRRIHFSQLPYSLSGDLINSWLDDDNFATTDIEKVYRILNIVFSSPACLNASFLRP